MTASSLAGRRCDAAGHRPGPGLAAARRRPPIEGVQLQAGQLRRLLALGAAGAVAHVPGLVARQTLGSGGLAGVERRGLAIAQEIGVADDQVVLDVDAVVAVALAMANLGGAFA